MPHSIISFFPLFNILSTFATTFLIEMQYKPSYLLKINESVRLINLQPKFTPFNETDL